MYPIIMNGFDLMNSYVVLRLQCAEIAARIL